MCHFSQGKQAALLDHDQSICFGAMMWKVPCLRTYSGILLFAKLSTSSADRAIDSFGIETGLMLSFIQPKNARTAMNRTSTMIMTSDT